MGPRERERELLLLLLLLLPATADECDEIDGYIVTEISITSPTCR